MAATTLSIRPQAHPLPLDLRRDLPDPLIPWAISKQTFTRLQKDSLKYKKTMILPTDPEWRFVWRYFHYDKPHRYGIKKIHCLHERHQQEVFELNISSIEREAQTFPPTWNQELRADQRAQTIERWKAATNLFSPFTTLEKGGRRRNWQTTKILPLWHGSSEEVCHSIATSGFIYFGKTSIGSKHKNDPKSTDEGFFGSGIYFTNSARYASDIYSEGQLLLAWVSMREPFPVVGDPNQEDMKALKGKGAYKHYNAHYIPVTSQNPNNSYESLYFPTKKGQQTHCDEVVVFQKSQTLPRFWVELEVEFPCLMTPFDVPQFVNELIPHLYKLLQNPHVDRDQKLRNTLNSELAILLTLQRDDYLEDRHEILYAQMVQLLDTQGKVKREVSRILTGSNPPSTQTLTQQFLQIELQPEPSSSLPAIPFSYPPPPLQIKPTNNAPPLSKTTPIAPPPKAFQPTIPAMAFGKAQWGEYFGDIGVEPPPP